MAEASDLEKKIIKQIEYYFGDANLPRDRFLQEQIRQEDGWVPLETMVKFNRLRQISDDLKVIAEAMKKSSSGLMEVNEEGTKIRRNADKPIPENTEQRRHNQTARTVYAKEFPLDVTLDELQELFEKYGEVESIYMRKNEKKAFKGSVFTTFKTADGVEAFLKAESVTFKDKPLEHRKTKSDYYKEKNEEKKKQQQDKEKKKQDAKNRQEVDEKRKLGNQLVPGAMLHLSGIAPGTTREDIKNLLQDYAPIAWVDFNKNDKEGWIRYEQKDQAKEVLEKVLAAMDNEIKLNGEKVEGRVLEGEEEMNKWVKMYEDMKERRNQNKRRHKPHQGRRPGKRFSKRTRDKLKSDAAGDDNDDDDDEDEGAGSDGGEVSDDEPVEKKVKKEPVEKKAEVEPVEKKVKVEDNGE